MKLQKNKVTLLNGRAEFQRNINGDSLLNQAPKVKPLAGGFGSPSFTPGDGETGLALAERQHPDLVILDLMVPKLDGWKVCRRLHRASEVPAIMLTAREEEVDRVAGLTLGADDYVVKPFSPRELMARIMSPLPETLSLLHDETLRLIRLAEDVLELARADDAGDRLHFEPIDLRAEVDADLAVYSPSFAQNAVTVKLHAPDGVPAVAADRRRIARVLRNLTENAAQYTPPQGNVDIRIETQGARVRVEFANDGGELTPADLPYIFERFYRGDKSRSGQKGGAGIGLAIVKELVEAHHGRVGAEISGSQVRVWFDLPCAPSAAA